MTTTWKIEACESCWWIHLGKWPLASELRAEIERLRAALQRIVDEAESDDGLSAWNGRDIAHEALEQSAKPSIMDVESDVADKGNAR